MRILSWDVGIYNLAYCLIDYTVESNKCVIVDWDIVNLNSNQKINNVATCSWKYKSSHKTKAGQVCSATAKHILKSTGKTYCLRHSKIAHSSLKSIFNILKSPVPFEKSVKKIKKPKKIKPSIHILGLNMVAILDSKPSLLNVDYILIENQPVLKNPTMKSVQMILYSYFLINSVVKDKSGAEIKFISARNKLKCYNGPPVEVKTKNKYSRTKKLAIEYCRYMIKDSEDKLEFFNQHKKKDDLADSYLQACWFVKNKYLKK